MCLFLMKVDNNELYREILNIVDEYKTLRDWLGVDMTSKLITNYIQRQLEKRCMYSDFTYNDMVTLVADNLATDQMFWLILVWFSTAIIFIFIIDVILEGLGIIKNGIIRRLYK